VTHETPGLTRRPLAVHIIRMKSLIWIKVTGCSWLRIIMALMRSVIWSATT